MRGLFVLVSCAACNSLLGLDQNTELDGPADAPVYACAPLPTFTKQPVRVFPGLSDYTADLHDDTLETAWSVAMTAIQEQVPGQGPFTSSQIMDVAIGLVNESPRLAPSGEQLFVRTKMSATGQQSFRYFIRGGSNDWANPVTIGFNSTSLFFTATDVVSTPSQGETQRRILVTQTTGGKQIHEFLEKGTTIWNEVNTPYTPAMFGLDDFSDPYMSPDGLAMMFVGVSHGESAVYITVRAGAEFQTTPTLLFRPGAGVTVNTPFLNRDCSKLYFTGSDGVYYTTP